MNLGIIFFIGFISGIIIFLILLPFVKREKIPNFLIDYETLRDEKFLELFINGLFCFKITMSNSDFEKFKDYVSLLENEEKEKFLWYLDQLNAKIKKGEIKIKKKNFLELVLKKKENIIISDVELRGKFEEENISFIFFPEISKLFRKKINEGEIIRVRIEKRGREIDEGVGFLPDGSVVIIKGGADYLGKEMEIKIRKIRETYAGLIYEAEIIKGEIF